MLRRVAVSVVLLGLAACGGGSESPDQNRPADAQADPRAGIQSLRGGPDRSTADSDRAFAEVDAASDRRGVAPDPTRRGPYTVASSEYKLPAGIDVLVAPFTVTEPWAQIHRPTRATGPRPVIVMLHGSHATCGQFLPGVPGRVDRDGTYTETGTCPEGFVVVPSHAGYAYLAEQLASWGFFVVSINANRGINGAEGDIDDFSLNLRRGRLILRHLVQLDQWNTGGGSKEVLGFDLRGQLDFGHVGLFGHSRGGEGARAALKQYRDPGSVWPSNFRNQPQFRALFELAPTDYGQDPVLSAEDVAWNVLLPTCDGDVLDLQGQWVFDRMLNARAESVPSPKSVFTVEGANHNFFNTEWQQADPAPCHSTDPAQPVLFDPAAIGSEAQRLTALYPVMAFFRAHLGSNREAAFGTLFDPAYRLPEKLTQVTRFRRAYTDHVAPAGSMVLDEFVGPVGAGDAGVGNSVGNLAYFKQSYVFEHDFGSQFGVLAWDHAANKRKGGFPFYQANAAVPGEGFSVNAFDTLEFRLSLACKDFRQLVELSCQADPALNPSGTTDFSIALALPDGRMSKAARLSRYAKPRAPVGVILTPIVPDPLGAEASQPAAIEPSPGSTVYDHAVLESVRIPIADFGLPKGATVRGARLVFNRASAGAIYLGNLRLTRKLQPTRVAGAVPFAAANAPPVPMRRAAPPSAARSASATLIGGGQVTRIERMTRPLATAAEVIAAARLSGPPAAPALREVVTMSIKVPEPLVIGGALLTLRIGDDTFRLGQAVSVPNQGMRGARFTLSPDAFAALPDGAAMVLENGAQRFDLGKLDKSRLR